MAIFMFIVLWAFCYGAAKALQRHQAAQLTPSPQPRAAHVVSYVQRPAKGWSN